MTRNRPAGWYRLALAAPLLVAALTASRPSAQVAAPPRQPADQMKGAVLKGKAPVSDDILQVKLPRAAEADLPNGIHLMVLEHRQVPVVSFNLTIIGAGGYYNPGGRPGTAGFTAALMREGTATRTSAEIARQLETMAATLGVGAGASSESAAMNGSSLTEHFDELLDLAADVLLNPSFPEDELTRFKVRTRAQLVQQRSSPGFLASELFNRIIYSDHPAAVVSPTVASLEQVTRAELAEFHRARYVPDHAVLAIAGDLSMAEARKLVTSRLGGWKKAGSPRPGVVDPKPHGAARVHLIERAGSVQTNLVVGGQAIDRRSPDYDVVDVMNKVIGGGPTGRLFMNLREDKGYTYGAYSFVSAPRYRGHWEASTEVRTDVTEPALRELMAEVKRLSSERVPDKEFRDARRSMVASFALSLESPGAILNRHVTRYLYGLPLDYWDTYPARIMAVTPDQVQAAARKYLDPTRLHIVAVGEGSKIGELLKQFGEVDRYDTEGRPIAKVSSGG
jgi:predicted Zn-dependent peptidase